MTLSLSNLEQVFSSEGASLSLCGTVDDHEIGGKCYVTYKYSTGKSRHEEGIVNVEPDSRY